MVEVPASRALVAANSAGQREISRVGNYSRVGADEVGAALRQMAAEKPGELRDIMGRCGIGPVLASGIAGAPRMVNGVKCSSDGCGNWKVHANGKSYAVKGPEASYQKLVSAGGRAVVPNTGLTVSGIIQSQLPLFVPTSLTLAAFGTDGTVTLTEQNLFLSKLKVGTVDQLSGNLSGPQNFTGSGNRILGSTFSRDQALGKLELDALVSNINLEWEMIFPAHSGAGNITVDFSIALFGVTFES